MTVSAGEFFRRKIGTRAAALTSETELVSYLHQGSLICLWSRIISFCKATTSKYTCRRNDSSLLCFITEIVMQYNFKMKSSAWKWLGVQRETLILHAGVLAHDYLMMRNYRVTAVSGLVLDVSMMFSPISFWEMCQHLENVLKMFLFILFFRLYFLIFIFSFLFLWKYT